MLILKILEGETAAAAEPVLVTTDADVIAAAGRTIAERLGVELPRVMRRGPEPQP